MASSLIILRRGHPRRPPRAVAGIPFCAALVRNASGRTTTDTPLLVPTALQQAYAADALRVANGSSAIGSPPNWIPGFGTLPTADPPDGAGVNAIGAWSAAGVVPSAAYAPAYATTQLPLSPGVAAPATSTLPGAGAVPGFAAVPMPFTPSHSLPGSPLNTLLRAPYNVLGSPYNVPGTPYNAVGAPTTEELATVLTADCSVTKPECCVFPAYRGSATRPVPCAHADAYEGGQW